MMPHPKMRILQWEDPKVYDEGFDTAWPQGAQAGDAVGENKNPYPPDTREWAMWQDGYDYAAWALGLTFSKE